MNLKDQIKLNKEKIAAANEVYIKALRTFKSIKFPIEKEQNDILDKFRLIINSKIEKEHTCEHCDPRLYDSAWFNDEGIFMRKSADHPNDFVDRTWTWDEIEIILTQGQSNE
jgi:hypothetical protein